jgi:hypothetical protein
LFFSAFTIFVVLEAYLPMVRGKTQKGKAHTPSRQLLKSRIATHNVKEKWKGLKLRVVNNEIIKEGVGNG